MMNGFYEYANVLFNLGAAESQLAAQILKGDSTERGCNEAFQHFQSAAQCISAASQYAREHDNASGGLCDLGSEEVCEALAQVLLGSAQYCVFSKGLLKSMSAAILSKLEGQVALFLEAGYRALQSLGAAKDFARHVHVACLVHKADTCLRLNDVLAAAGKHELRLGRLQQAVAALDEAKRGVAKLPSGPAQQELRAHVDRLAATAHAAVQKGMQENSLIYHCNVPSVATLPPLDGAPMAKLAFAQDVAAAVDPASGAQQQQHFGELTPVHIKSAVSAYNDRRGARVAGILAGMEDADRALGAALGEMGLPAKLEALAAAATNGGNDASRQQQLPPQLVEKAATVRQEGGARNVEERVALVASMAGEAAKAIDEAEALVEAEEREDNELRSKYAQRWTRCPSYSINTGFREEIAKLRTHAAAAKKSDALVAERWRAAADAVALLERPPEEIAAQLPGGMDPGMAAALARAPETEALRADLNALKQIAGDRMAARNALQQAAAQDDITQAVYAAQDPSSYEDIYQESLRKYDAFEEAAQASAAEQGDALSRTSRDNMAFEDARRAASGGGGDSDPRTEALQRLDTAYKTFGELRANLTEGVNFYSELQTRIQNLKNKISDFTYARQTEKQDLLAALTGGAGGGAAAGGGAPPQRPPKPSSTYPQGSYPPPQQQQQQQPAPYGQQVPGGWSPYQQTQYSTSYGQQQQYGGGYQYGGYPPQQQQYGGYQYGGYPQQQPPRW